MKLRPLGDRVILKTLEDEAVTSSGIVLSNTQKEKPFKAVVLAVGPGTEEVTMEVKVNDKVIYSKYSGTEVELDKESYIVVKQNDILAIIE